MGALTSNRKRGDDQYSLNYRFPFLNSTHSDSRIDTHISKKPKSSSSMQTNSEQPLSSRSAGSRVHKYPEPVNQIPREVHAPCRFPKFRFGGSSNREARPKSSRVEKEEDLSDVMGNVLSFRYDQAKNSAIGALRYFKKDKEVIDVDSESDKGDVSEDLSIQEVEVVEDGRKWRSVVSDQRSQEISGFEINAPELGGKVVDHKLQPSSSSVVSDLRNSNLKMESPVKMLDSHSLDGELDVLGMSIHKKLQQTADKRNPKLCSLSFQIELMEKRLFEFQLVRSVKKPVDEDVLKDLLHESFVPLTKEEADEVSLALSNSSRRKVLVTHENSNIQITVEVLQCLRPGAWLNDELIGGKNGYDFKSVRRWTSQKKLGYCLLECDKIFVPIHKEVHWCLAVINKKDEKFQYLDSLRGIDSHVLKVLARYVVDEVKDKSGEDIDVSLWQQEYVQDLPEQENGFDCGMFMIKYADFYSRGLGLCFKQEHMPYFRLRTAKEILRLKAE